MRRFPDWLLYGLIAGGLWLYARIESDGVAAPPPPTHRLGELLPAQSPRDERILVDVAEPESGVGTAFAVDRRGTWITARHVVDGCDDVALRAGPFQGVLADRVRIDPEADLAVIDTEWNRTPLPSDIVSPKFRGQRGYFFGFPQGRPGEVSGALMGRAFLRVRGRYQTEEPVFAWSETGRTRGLRGSLGGLSGAPALDADGEVIGVVAAESPRRGRIFTVAPVSLRDVFVDPRGAAEPIGERAYGTRADELRRERRVVQVICGVD